MKGLVIVSAVLCWTLQVISSYDTTVLEGRRTSNTSHPFVVTVNTKRGDHLCTGSIITLSWVVTSAHCFEDPTKRSIHNIVVLAGVNYDTHSFKEGKQKKVKRLIISPSYDGINSDWGLLKVSRPFKSTSKVDVIGLTGPNLKLPPGTSVRVYGWELVTLSDSTPSLLYTDMKIVSNNECQQKYQKLRYGKNISNTHLCAVPISKRAEIPIFFCGCDSGGPVVLEKLLIGLVLSDYRNCDTRNIIDAPYVFTHLAPYVDTIGYAVTKGRNLAIKKNK